MHLAPRIPHHESVKNIIFDFGGVICNLDLSRTIAKFREFGQPREENRLQEEEQNKTFDKLVEVYETGMMTSQQFREKIRSHYISSPGDALIDEAWNALLAGIPEDRIWLLEDIRKFYRIFLLSNSNEIHFLKFRQNLHDQFGYPDFDSLFEKAYFSYKVHIRKPNPEIFRLVLKENELLPSETLFIDDTPGHVESANKLNIIGYHLNDSEDITSLFTKP